MLDSQRVIHITSCRDAQLCVSIVSVVFLISCHLSIVFYYKLQRYTFFWNYFVRTVIFLIILIEYDFFLNNLGNLFNLEKIVVRTKKNCIFANKTIKYENTIL